jgi:ABC-type amino acid transport substrate-binding protein
VSFLAGLWLAWLPLSAAALPPLRFLVLDAHSMPFSEFKNTASGRLELTGGIIKDWQDALARELHRTPVNIYYSRMRQDQAAASGQVDLRCFVSPEWVPPALRQQYDWPTPFMHVEERLAGSVGKPQIRSVNELHGKTVGMVLGYRYPALEPLFDRHLANRDNAPNEAGVLAKQLAGRTDYMAVRTLDFYYLQRQNPALGVLQLSPLVINIAPLYCARPKTSQLSLEELVQAQQRLLDAGTMEKILQRYR